MRAEKRSIQRRLVVVTSLTLIIFLSLAGGVLDRAYRASLYSGAEEQLKLVVYTLMGAARESQGRLVFDQPLAEPRFSQPDSGLYAMVRDEGNSSLWVSPSALMSDNVVKSLPPSEIEPGRFVLQKVSTPEPHLYLSYAVFWEGLNAKRFVFSAVSAEAPLIEAVNTYRVQLAAGLGVSILVFILGQWVALRWGLRPLFRMQREITQMEAGHRDQLSTDYPVELQGLANNLHGFIAHEKNLRERYRQSLDNFAHSLKTPLTAIRNALDATGPSRDIVDEQVERINDVIKHQLSGYGGVKMGGISMQRIDLVASFNRIRRVLEVAYPDMTIVYLGPSQCDVTGSQTDWMEILGNLLDNACKYGRSCVRVRLQGLTAAAPDQWSFIIEDDGDGIPVAQREEVLNRGERLDTQVAGQGIGLAVAATLLRDHQVDLHIESSLLGGAKIILTSPAKS